MAKKKNFFISLLSPEGELSSKRFAGLVLIGTAVAGAILAYVLKDFTEMGESMAKTTMYTGSALLGANMIENTMKTVGRANTKPNEQVK